MNSIQGILYNRPAVDSVYKEFNQKSLQNNINKIPSKKIFLTKEIDLKNINFKYSDIHNSERIVDTVTNYLNTYS